MRDEPVSDEMAKEAIVDGLERAFTPVLLNGDRSKDDGSEESMLCDDCSGTGAVLLGAHTCPTCRGQGKRFIVRPAAIIIHMPTLHIECGCGRDHDCPVPEVVKDFQRTGIVPPIECGCGRILIGQRRLVLA